MSAGHLVMVLAGLLGVALTLRVLQTADDTRPVLVAAADLVPGTVLDDDVVATARISADTSVVAALFHPDDLDQLRGQVLTDTLDAGALVTRSDVRPVADGSASRAMSFAISTDRAVGGDLDAGDRIDVIAVEDAAASYIMRDVEILRVERDDGGPLGGGGDDLTITLAVDADAALTFAIALDAGTVTLVRTTGATP